MKDIVFFVRVEEGRMRGNEITASIFTKDSSEKSIGPIGAVRVETPNDYSGNYASKALREWIAKGDYLSAFNDPAFLERLGLPREDQDVLLGILNTMREEIQRGVALPDKIYTFLRAPSLDTSESPENIHYILRDWKRS
jgi:hypothetical protein